MKIETKRSKKKDSKNEFEVNITSALKNLKTGLDGKSAKKLQKLMDEAAKKLAKKITKLVKEQEKDSKKNIKKKSTKTELPKKLKPLSSETKSLSPKVVVAKPIPVKKVVSAPKKRTATTSAKKK